MRSLQTKQPPAVRFTYQDSPSQPPRNQYQNRSQSLPKTFTVQPQSTNNIRKANFGESSHIKIVEMAEPEERRQRRHKIFEEIGAIARLSKSKSRERNRSYSIFNGVPQEGTTKIKELVMSKESCKQQSVQTEVINDQKEQKISTFMQSAQKNPPSLPMRPIQLDLPLDEPLQLSKYTYTATQAQNLQKQLSLKEKQLAYLKLQLERHERCERITHENESIYKRLVQKLDNINQSTVSTLQRQQESQRESKKKSKSPHRTHRQESPSDTTRFMHPPTTKKQSNKKEVLNNVLNQITPSNDPLQPQNIKNQLSKSNAITFYRQQHRKTTKGNRSIMQLQLPQPIMTDEQLKGKLEESVRRYTSTITFDEVPIKDKLASINRHLQNKYAQRETHNSRAASQSRYQQRGKSIASGPRHHLHL